MVNDEPYLVLVRGLPGSGKSTLAKVLCTLVPSMYHIENDMYRIREDGKYVYDPEDYSFVRDMSLRDVTHLLSNGNPVVISNVFTSEDTMRMYTDLPYRKVILRTTGDFGSIYDVPEDNIEDILVNFKDVDGEIVLGDLDTVSIHEIRLHLGIINE